MKSLYIFLILVTFSIAAHSDVCGRRYSVVESLQEMTHKSCDQISESDLEKITDLPIFDNADSESFYSTDFENLPNLKMLHIFYSAIKSLPPDVFAGAPNIETLIIGNTLLESIPSAALRTLPSLKALALESNKISSFASTDFDHLGPLKALYLRDNPAPFIPMDLPVLLPNIEELGFLAKIPLPSGFLGRFTKLRELAVSSNQFNKNDFNGLNIVRLHISDDMSDTTELVLPEGLFENLPKLKGLAIEISFSNFFIPENLFRGLHTPKTVSIRNCTFLNFTQDTFSDMKNNLRYLTIYDPVFQKIDPSPFNQLDQLRYLDLNFETNSTNFIGNFFGGMENLRNLDVSLPGGAQFQEDLLKNLPSLEELHLRKVEIALPLGIFKGLDKLRILETKIVSSHLESQLFSDLKSLENVKLTSGNIEFLSEDLFSGLYQLKKIDLRNNKISSTPENLFFDIKDNLTQVRVGQNSLDQKSKDSLTKTLGNKVIF